MSVTLPFPTSSTPGTRPGEGEGRLVNAYAEKAGGTLYFRRVPGLSVRADTGRSGPRGLIDVNGTVYACIGTSVVKVAASGAVTVLSGAIPGTDGVTFARNNRTSGGISTPDVVAVRETGGAYVVTASAVTAYPDADLPASANSVAFLDGFLVFSVADGRIFASELNSTDINALSVATAEAQPDGLVRGIVQGGICYAMGTSTIEPWRNIGTAPFPLQRSPSVIPVGLKTAMAVAGFEPGWDREPIFVAHDGTVRVLSGYDTAVISTPDVEAFIAASTVSTLEACVFTAKGKAFWALSSDRGTWVYEVTSQQWHERVSQGASRWRASRSVKSGNTWVLGDTLSTKLLTVADNLTTEAGNPVAWTLESGPAKEFPTRVAVPATFFDFTMATGVSVQISYSHDGGQSWSSPVTRVLDKADTYAVRVNRMGFSTQHGMRVRLSSSSTADFSFMGATVPDLQPRQP